MSDSPILIVTICSRCKKSGGREGYDTSSMQKTWASEETQRLRRRRDQVLQRLQACETVRDSLMVKDMPSNRALLRGPDFGGDASPEYLPAVQRYNGDFYQALGSVESRLELVTTVSAPHMLIISTLYGLLAPDELIQDYDCYIKDDAEIATLWTVNHYLTDLLRSYVRQHRIQRIFELAGDDDYRQMVCWPSLSRTAQVLHVSGTDSAGAQSLPALGSFARQHLFGASVEELLGMQNGQSFPTRNGGVVLHESAVSGPHAEMERGNDDCQ